MSNWKRLLAIAVVLTLGWMVGDARAWHGPRFGYPGYGFGANHQSFYSPYCGTRYYGSSWNVGYRSYWPSSFYYSGYRNCWPTYNVGYRYRAPSLYYSTYYAPTCVSPISYSSYYYSIPTCYTAPSYSTWPIGYVAPVTYSTGYGIYPSCSTTSVDLRAALASVSLPKKQIAVKSKVSPSLVKRAAADPAQLVSTAKFDGQQGDNNVPSELLNAADAILASGGYREAAKAYAQLSLTFGNSGELYARRFVAQVAAGDYEQAAVIINLMNVNHVRIAQSDLPKGDLRVALGVKDRLISQRSEGLAANALVQATDPVPLETIATWLELSGDEVRAKLFQQRAGQLRTSQNRATPEIDRIARKD